MQEVVCALYSKVESKVGVWQWWKFVWLSIARDQSWRSVGHAINICFYYHNLSLSITKF